MKPRINGMEKTTEFWRRYFVNKKLRALGKPTIPLEPTPQTTSKSNTEPDTPDLPIISYRDDIETTYELKYARTNLMADRIMQSLSGNVFGFDAEWRVAWGRPQRPTALVQICDGNIIALLHLIHMESFPTSLRSFLEDSTMIKTGVNVTGDATRLNKEFSLKTAGLVELGSNAHYIMPELINTTRPTLAKLTSNLLNKSLNKGPVRMSNWERAQLSPEQREYAATDAYVSYKLYRVLEARGAPMYSTEQEKIAKETANSKSTKKQADLKSTSTTTTTTPVSADSSNDHDTITDSGATPTTNDVKKQYYRLVEDITITTSINEETTSNIDNTSHSVVKRRQTRKSTSTDTVSTYHTASTHNNKSNDTCNATTSTTLDENTIEIADTSATETATATTTTKMNDTTAPIKRSRGRPRKDATTPIASSMAAPAC
ncbi:ribonuclease H-like domain-containing protein [Syncephalis plumigaleata]|nr:ribonuclease H-like domain-containing protein [Syncephalis plumigaleata]